MIHCVAAWRGVGNVKTTFSRVNPFRGEQGEVFGPAKMSGAVQTPEEAGDRARCGRRLRCLVRFLYLFFVRLGPLLALHFVMTRCTCTRALWWRWMARAAERSGAVVIKLAQWAGSRPDMFGSEVCSQLVHLQDRTPTHAWRHTSATLDEMFGPEWPERLELERTPVGSGCIAQVYRGRMRVPRERGFPGLPPPPPPPSGDQEPCSTSTSTSTSPRAEDGSAKATGAARPAAVSQRSTEATSSPEGAEALAAAVPAAATSSPPPTVL